jgi:hypothetical protein
MLRAVLQCGPPPMEDLRGTGRALMLHQLRLSCVQQLLSLDLFVLLDRRIYRRCQAHSKYLSGGVLRTILTIITTAPGHYSLVS